MTLLLVIAIPLLIFPFIVGVGELAGRAHDRRLERHRRRRGPVTYVGGRSVRR